MCSKGLKGNDNETGWYHRKTMFSRVHWFTSFSKKHTKIRYIFEIYDFIVLPDPERIAPIVNVSAPTTVKKLRRFLGMLGYYAKFLSDD